MDAEDIRIAQERIAHSLSRVAELQDRGIDTSDLSSQISFARSALEQGRTLDVLAICEEVLLSARKLGAAPAKAPTPPPAAAPAPAKENTSRYASGVYATPNAEALDRHRLTEEIRQVVQGDLMPKAMTPAQLNERIEKMVTRAFDNRLDAFQHDLEERFQRLASTPETKAFTRNVAGDEHLLEEVDRRLEARAAGIAKHTAQGIADATAGIESRLADLADPARLRAAIASAVESSIAEGLARIDLDRQESAARRAVGGADQAARTDDVIARLTAAVEAIDGSLSDRIRGVVDERISQGVERTIADHLGELRSDLDERFQRLASTPETKAFARPEADAEAMARLTAAVDAIDGKIAAAVDERLAGASQSIADSVSAQVATVAPAPADLDGLIARLGKDLRDDFAWQVERLAAERGWVSIADVQAELAKSPAPGAAGGSGPGFARLEAALVEFVRQTQAQQQQFLEVLHEKVERGTAVVAQQIAKHGSETFAAPTPDTGTIQRADGDRSALESNAARATEASLDVLSQSAQFRAISTLGDPQRPATGHFLPGTQVTRRTELPAEPEPAPETVLTALEASGARSAARLAEGIDDGAGESTAQAPSVTADLDTEVMELQPLSGTDLRLDAAVLPPAEPATVALGRGGSGSRSAPAAPAPASAPATSALSRDPAAAAGGATGRVTSRVAALEASLRLLVRKEVAQQIGQGSGTVPADPAGSAAAGPLQREDLVRLLQDPAVRQQVLGIVAVEAVGNPGALGELTGIRAFIRAEVRKAAQEASSAPDAEKASDAMT